MNNKPDIFIACDSSYDAAKLVLFGAPFDGTSCYRPGSRFAGSAIRAESFGLETYSPYLRKDLRDVDVFDAGDLDMPFGNKVEALSRIETAAASILSAGKIPFMIGGEHLVTLGAVNAAVAKYRNLNIIHFDAHADLCDEYFGEKLSHAAVMRRCHELLEGGEIYQFGIRSMAKDEDEFAQKTPNISQRKYDLETLDDALVKLEGKPVYITIDLDVLDPSIFPGTGTPEPGGVSFADLMEAIHMLSHPLEIIGCDVNELSPHYDQSGVSTITACKVIREFILTIL